MIVTYILRHSPGTSLQELPVYNVLTDHSSTQSQRRQLLESKRSALIEFNSKIFWVINILLYITWDFLISCLSSCFLSNELELFCWPSLSVHWTDKWVRTLWRRIPKLKFQVFPFKISVIFDRTRDPVGADIVHNYHVVNRTPVGSIFFSFIIFFVNACKGENIILYHMVDLNSVVFLTFQ